MISMMNDEYHLVVVDQTENYSVVFVFSRYTKFIYSIFWKLFIHRNDYLVWIVHQNDYDVTDNLVHGYIDLSSEKNDDY